MPVGKLDILLTIQQPTEVKNSVTGQLQKSWSDWNITFAESISRSSDESEKSSQISSTDARMFRIRYIPGMTTKMRLYDPEMQRYYEITGMQPEGRRAYLVIFARSTNVNAPA